MDYIQPGCFVRCIDEDDRKTWRVLQIVRELVCCTDQKTFHFSRVRVVTPPKLRASLDV